jgi:hypothetical protein
MTSDPDPGPRRRPRTMAFQLEPGRSLLSDSVIVSGDMAQIRPGGRVAPAHHPARIRLPLAGVGNAGGCSRAGTSTTLTAAAGGTLVPAAPGTRFHPPAHLRVMASPGGVRNVPW